MLVRGSRGQRIRFYLDPSLCPRGVGAVCGAELEPTRRSLANGDLMSAVEVMEAAAKGTAAEALVAGWGAVRDPSKRLRTHPACVATPARMWSDDDARSFLSVCPCVVVPRAEGAAQGGARPGDAHD